MFTQGRPHRPNRGGALPERAVVGIDCLWRRSIQNFGHASCPRSFDSTWTLTTTSHLLKPSWARPPLFSERLPLVHDFHPEHSRRVSLFPRRVPSRVVPACSFHFSAVISVTSFSRSSVIKYFLLSSTTMLARTIIRNTRLARGYATHAKTTSAPAVLHLKTGQSFHGRSFGAPKSIFGETVFSTSITSCKCLRLLIVHTVSLTQVYRH